MTVEPASGWRASFAGFDLDTTSYELRRAGRPVHLEPQAFDVLAHLVRNRDRVVSKEELLDTVWGDRFVSESALTSRVKHVRAALGDDGRSQAFVRTVHGRGYRFAPVTPVAVSGPDPLTASAPVGTDGRYDVPAARTPLVGRQAMVSAVAGVLRDERLVTLLGIGGIGKSRLAAAVAHLCGDRFDDGVRFVRVGSCAGVREVEDAVFDAAGVGTAADELTRRVHELRSRPVLLVLDGAELVRDELAATVDRLLDRTLAPRFLVTSQVPLELPDERRVPVPPLPHGGTDTPAERLLGDTAERYGVRPSAGDRHAVRTICRLLDGLPLAIELAGAALRVLAPDDLAERLEHGHLELLRARRPGHDRHADLVAALEAGRDRLDPAAHDLLVGLAARGGPFTVADAERVRDDLPPYAVAAALGQLVDLSMVVAAGSGRFRLLTTVRLLAGRHLPAVPGHEGARPDARTAHARRFRPLPAEWSGAAG